jgi:hypothetical protein
VRRLRAAAGAAGVALAIGLLLASPASAPASGSASWSGREQPSPPGTSGFPVGLGKIGDIEFFSPDRGLLITEGEPPTIPEGIWAYNGVEWHELATVCGATDGRIAWAGPDEFWTVSNGRAGQANEVGGNGTEKAVPIEDNTLCHFSAGQLIASYAHPANQPDSYQAMHAAACLDSSDCWFGGDPLPEPQIGSFHLHWNGSSLENAPYLGEGHAVEDMRMLEGHLYESVQVGRTDQGESSTTPVVHRINPEGTLPVIEPEEGLFGEGLPLYAPGELPTALGFLHLATAEGALWGAAGPSSDVKGVPGQVTVARAQDRSWIQLIGPEHPLGPILPDASEETALLGTEAKNAQVSAIAAEHGGGDAWIALAPREGSSADARAVLLHVSSEGAVLEEQTLPTSGEEAEGIGPKGAAARITCPAVNDCWLATTRGWLFHLAPAGERTLPRDGAEGEYFNGLITYRPRDLGLPQVPPDAPPADDSGLVEEAPNYGGTFAESKATTESRVTLPLLSHMHSRLVHGSTLELLFHLQVKARIRLVAKRRQAVVAATPPQIFKAGNRKLLLKLNPKRWPTKLSLQSHALVPLPTVPSAFGEGAGITTETTRLFVMPKGLPQGSAGTLP